MPSGLALLAIFVLLVLLFNSASQPLLVLGTIPFGFAGVLLAFAIHGIALDIGALLATLGLAGVVINDALVMIDSLNRRKLAVQNALTDSLLIEGASARLRPVFITTVTTVAGLLPAAYEIFGPSTFTTTMAMALLWGLLAGSLATIFILPCAYRIHQDLQLQWQALWSRKRINTVDRACGDQERPW